MKVTTPRRTRGSISALSGPPKLSNASPKRTCKSRFGSSLPLILRIIHWINEDPNKRMKGFVQV